MTNIYIGNLPFSTSEDEVRDLFSAYGTVDNVSLIADRETGRLRGFGFVEMSSGGDEAVAALNQSELSGRRLVVNLAKPREERRPRRWWPGEAAVRLKNPCPACRLGACFALDPWPCSVLIVSLYIRT